MSGAPAVGVLCASPRPRGRSARVAQAVADGLRAGGCEPVMLDLRDLDVRPCTGCGACERGACPIRDDAGALVGALDACEGLALVSPVYFAGPPARLKAALDRMQPLWAARYVRRVYPALPAASRRPLALAAVGAGGDPFGHEPLATCSRSALRMLDYELCASAGAIGGDAAADGRVGLDLGRTLAAAAQARPPFARAPRATGLGAYTTAWRADRAASGK